MNKSMAKNMKGLKRPVVLFAIIFAFSAFLCSKGLVVAAFFASLALASAAAVFSFCSKLRAASVFCLLLSFFVIYPAITLSVSKYRANMAFENESSVSVQAVVQDKTEMYNKTVLYVTLSGNNCRGLRTAVVFDENFACELFDKLEIDGIPFGFENQKETEFYTQGYPTKEKALSKGCVSGIYAKDIKNLGRIPKNERSILHNYYFYINDNLKKSFKSLGSVDTFSYATALLTGDRSYLSGKTVDNFTHSGLVAILCISGLHVVISTEFLNFFLKKLQIKKTVSSFIIIAFLSFLVIITGFRGSVMRAAVMSIFFYLAQITGKRIDPISPLFAAFVAVSLANPFCIFDAGTLLSFLAMTGLVFSQIAKDNYFEERKGLYAAARNSLSASVHVQTFAAFPIIKMFGGFSLVSPFSNLFVSTFFAPLMFMLVLCAFLCFLPSSLLSVLAFIPRCLIALLEESAKVFASIPFSYAMFSLPDIAIYAFSALFLAFLLSAAFFKNKYLLITGFSCFVLTNAVTISLFVLSFICN